MWICEIYRHSPVSEYPVIRGALYAYHCTHLCSQIRRQIDTGDHAMLLSSASSILREMDEVEQATRPLSHEKEFTSHIIDKPLAPHLPSEAVCPDHGPQCSADSCKFYAYHNNFRMRVSLHILEFLFHASRAPGCTLGQQILFAKYQQQCINEIRVLVKKSTFILTRRPFNIGSSLTLRRGPQDDNNLFRVMWWRDAMDVLCRDQQNQIITIGGIGTPKTIEVRLLFEGSSGTLDAESGTVGIRF